MDYSDDDVLASGGEEQVKDDTSSDHDLSGVSEDVSTEGQQPNAAQQPAAAVAAAATGAAHASTGVAGGFIKDTQHAVLSGELTANAALLQLQLSDLLSEVALCHSKGKQVAVQTLVASVAAALAELPAQAVSMGTSAGQQQTGIAALVSSWGVDPQDMTVDVQPPVTVQLVGSWALGAAMDLPGTVVDVAVQIPKCCLHHKDHLNYRYHAKRALYLHALAQHLAAHPVFAAAQQQLAPLHGDPCRPALLLHLDSNQTAAAVQQRQLQVLQQPQGRFTGLQQVAAAATAAGLWPTGLVLRLIPVIGLDAFELSKLAPDRNNVRWATANSSSSQKQHQQQGSEQQLLPTPHYNAAILQDLLLLLHQHRLQQAVRTAGPQFVDALLLLKVWAQQCGLSSTGVLPTAAYSCYGGNSTSSSSCGSSTGNLLLGAAAATQADGLSGHFLAHLLLAAVQQAGVAAANAMSPLQQLRCALQLLADQRLWAKGVMLQPDPSVPLELRLLAQQEQQSIKGSNNRAAAAASAEPVAGKVSKDQVKLQQRLQQQVQQLPASPAASWLTAHDVLFLDSTGHLNMAAFVSKSSLQLAQLAARRSLDILNCQDGDSEVVYSAMFRSGQLLSGVFDYWWTVELPAQFGDSTGSISAAAKNSAGSEEQQQQEAPGAPGDLHSMRSVEAQVEGLVQQALTSRAVLVRAIRRPPVYPSRPSQQQSQQQQRQQPSKGQKKRCREQQQPDIGSSSSSTVPVWGPVSVPRRIVVAAVVDPVAATRVVDVGPPADNAVAAAKYRALWGDKAQLRRFPDGKINEAVVWEGVPPGERHRIPDLAVQYLLLHHLPAGTTIQSCSTALDALLYPGVKPADTLGPSKHTVLNNSSSAKVAVRSGAAGKQAVAGTAKYSTAASSTAVTIGIGNTAGIAAAETAASRAADTALDTLAKQLRGLSGVALNVIGVQSLSSVSRHTCCFYPEPHPLAEGGGSGVYTPDVKVARVMEPMQVMVQLEGTGKLPSDPVAFAKTKAALGVQLASALCAACGAHVTATEEALEVLWQGFAFQLLLYIDRDSSVLSAMEQTDSSSSSSSSSQVPLPLLMSRHHGLVSSLEAAHAAYASTVRLAQRWLGLNLLLGSQVTPEAVELLVGAVFVGPSVFAPPASRISGLLAFWRLLASHPWSASPLLVDPAGEVGPAARQKLQAEFEARRAAGNAPGIFIATPYDLHYSKWTARHPSQSVVHHLASRAAAAYHPASLLLLLGPDAPAAQQQLQQLLSFDSRKRSRGSHGSNSAAEVQELQQEFTALGRAWRFVAGPNLSGFDAWILIRNEAVPYSERTDAVAAEQVKQLLALHKQQQQLLVLPGAVANGQKRKAKPEKTSKRAKKHKWQLNEADGLDSKDFEGVANGFASVNRAAPQGLLQLVTAAGQVETPKAARAVLRSIPEQVLSSKPVDKLRAELLLGFNPIAHYLQLCNERYGHMATFCADTVSCFGAIGIKWKPEAFVPALLRPGSAHGMMELGVTCSVAAAAIDGSKQRKGSAGSAHVGWMVPNVAQILSELSFLGLGLVQEIALL